MKHKVSGIIGASLAIGLGAILVACTTAPTLTPAPEIAATQPAISASPTMLPATQPPAQPAATVVAPTATAGPTEVETLAAANAPAGLPCTSPAALTPAQTEGPYYTPDTPERASLIEPGMGGTKLIVTGRVLTTDCQPVARAWLDFWQADDQGEYDNAGYRLRGHLFTDEAGRYTLETIVPGEYPGRTPHIHVKVQPPSGSILTSQIYFPGVAANDRDAIFDPALLAVVQDTAAGKVALFDFVVSTQ